ncbi:unnamed protein product [Thlaspi arvense]|uniref:SLC26A/SulP transporter domain-containing protein n=1 Tax=Thlaspi arvense TaxID=13288 RepID=A0AAU9S9I7_THLAR|nr:unnamed protein product [Thlaspi arvense]
MLLTTISVVLGDYSDGALLLEHSLNHKTHSASPLASVAISTLLVYLIRSKTHAISSIGHLPKGLNPPSSNMLYFSSTHLALAIKTGSFSRSAVSYNTGAKTAVFNIVMASAVLVTLLFLMPLFYYTPNLILAAIILTAVIGGSFGPQDLVACNQAKHFRIWIRYIRALKDIEEPQESLVS